MPFESRRAKLIIGDDALETLRSLSKSRKEAHDKVERAKILLWYHEGRTVSEIAREIKTNRPRVERVINKALYMGILAALRDLPRRGRSKLITPEARAWLISIACRKPKDFNYASELWTTRLLAQYIRQHCEEQGHACLKKIGRGTVSKILSKSEIRPHKITYYLEKRDADFDQKMIQVLHAYKEVYMLRDKKNKNLKFSVVSYDEKPGIQAIGTVAPDRMPVKGAFTSIARDREYIRYGTLTLLAAIDLFSGQIHGIVKDRHRSAEFIEFLKMLNYQYKRIKKIKIILDNHSAHISKETNKYLAKHTNRFEFIFTPKHGSWLNIIETFFSKMTRSFLRGLRVDSKKELKERIEKYLDEVNECPVIYKWKYKMEDIDF